MIPHRVETREEEAVLWPMIAPWLEKALDAAPDDEATLVDVFVHLRSPDYHLWVADNAAIVTNRVPAKGGPVLHVWLVGGKMDGVMALHPLVESFARQLGCKAMTAFGRTGWQRSFLPNSGWQVSQVEMRKRL